MVGYPGDSEVERTILTADRYVRIQLWLPDEVQLRIRRPNGNSVRVEGFLLNKWRIEP
jgi:hypothetical protein